MFPVVFVGLFLAIDTDVIAIIASKVSDFTAALQHKLLRHLANKVLVLESTFIASGYTVGFTQTNPLILCVM